MIKRGLDEQIAQISFRMLLNLNMIKHIMSSRLDFIEF